MKIEEVGNILYDKRYKRLIKSIKLEEYSCYERCIFRGISNNCISIEYFTKCMKKSKDEEYVSFSNVHMSLFLNSYLYHYERNI